MESGAGFSPDLEFEGTKVRTGPDDYSNLVSPNRPPDGLSELLNFRSRKTKASEHRQPRTCRAPSVPLESVFVAVAAMFPPRH